MNNTNKLPTIPSELVQVGLNDMKATIAAGHKIDMSDWGVNTNEKVCTVCLGGAVLMNTLELKVEHGNYRFWDNVIDGTDKNAINALDSIRKGYLADFLGYLEVNIDERVIDKYDNNGFKVNEYIQGWVEYQDCDNDEQFYNQMEDVIKYLKSKGI